MSSLDHLGWVDGLSFSCHGLRIGIRTDAPGLLTTVGPNLPVGVRNLDTPLVDHLYSLWTHAGQSPRGVRHFAFLYSGTETVARSLDPGRLLVALQQHLHTYVATMNDQVVFVEDAIVIVWRDAAALLVGGDPSTRSMVGSACADAGATCLSTTSAVVDGSGRACTGARTLPVRALFFLDSAAGGTWEPKAVSAGRSVVSLMQRVPSASRRPVGVLAALHRLVDGTPLRAGASSAVGPVVADVLAALDHQGVGANMQRGDEHT